MDYTMGDFIESTEIPCVAEIQTMGTIMVPSSVSIDRIIIEPRDNPHLGDFRLIVTVDGALVYSGETPRGRYTVDVEDSQTKDAPRQIIVVVIPMDVPTAIRSYLKAETVQITAVGTHHGESEPDDSVPWVRAVDVAFVEVDTSCLTDPDSCAFDADFSARWS